jgi:hypothetical protein
MRRVRLIVAVIHSDDTGSDSCHPRIVAPDVRARIANVFACFGTYCESEEWNLQGRQVTANVPNNFTAANQPSDGLQQIYSSATIALAFTNYIGSTKDPADGTHCFQSLFPLLDVDLAIMRDHSRNSGYPACRYTPVPRDDREEVAKAR